MGGWEGTRRASVGTRREEVKSNERDGQAVIYLMGRSCPGMKVTQN